MYLIVSIAIVHMLTVIRLSASLYLMLYLGLIVTSCRCLGFLSVTVLYLHYYEVSLSAVGNGPAWCCLSRQQSHGKNVVLLTSHRTCMSFGVSWLRLAVAAQ